MPKLSDQLRAERRLHILTSAWGCFSRNGFHATSMDDIITATGMSSSAVYRYFRSKDELIDAAADEALAAISALLDKLLAADPVASPAGTLTALVDEVHAREAHADYDLTRIVIQAWGEALRRPPMEERTRAFYLGVRRQLTELAARWRDAGFISPDARPEDMANVVMTLMPGLLVNHHLVQEVPVDHLVAGLAAFGGGRPGQR
ncbi:TetR/AcrR family transcriptional regulator [Actinacidiphila oryziradicis]|uniref:TetR/AcrR family transcriptional regulator n=1 Tax=Actinacidiphila oryziradicis TaxID=2571141 RepID=A0A4U0RWV9_9ACTN|nr:TetR/AcrR family transcriptional regulator [Actinacidiphila oryziradicis]TJZ99300.1 TetR/AcrR family transcriptional regulator [Actinacidiphila oryziradicis]